MNWATAREYIKDCQFSWGRLKKQFSGKERKILDESYLAIDYEGQTILQSSPCLKEMGSKHKTLFCGGFHTEQFLALVNLKQTLEKQLQEVPWFDAQTAGALKKRMADTDDSLSNFNTDELELNNFTVEVRFKQLRFELIQKLKKSDYCDSEKTDMSPASIRIVLKPTKPKDEKANGRNENKP